MLGYMYTNFAFFHQLYDYLKDMEPYMREISGQIHQSRLKSDISTKSYLKEMKEILSNTSDQYNPLVIEKSAKSNSAVPEKQGYLYKRGSQRMRPTWSRRFFKLHDGKMLYFSHDKEEEESPTIIIDLRLCSVKPAEIPDRRFCFELISPIKSYLLQAENDIEMLKWIEAIQQSISIAINTQKDVQNNGLDV